MLQPAREAAAQPLELTLLYTDDDARALTVDIPKQLTVNITNGDLPPAPLTLARDPKVPDRLRLSPGQYRRVRYTAAWPIRRAAPSKSIPWASMSRRCSSR